jgi:pimeloyl-ACP methyl ester carboxylesterase
MLGLKGITKKVSNLNQMENLYHIRERFSIIHDNKIIGIQMKWEGKREKPPMLMLPALSTVSRSDEWQHFKAIVTDKYQLITIDWPGFGESDKIDIHYSGTVLQETLKKAIKVIQSKNNRKLTIIAAGHSASVVLTLKDKYINTIKQIVLIAPTWRGPLPSMTGWSPKRLNIINEIVRLPIIGPMLYFINTTKVIIRFMMKRHVWLNKNDLDNDKIRKLQVLSRQKGARYASAAFVTGRLDIDNNNKWWISNTNIVKEMSTLVIPKDSPKRSLSEMEALSESIKDVLYIRGRLGCHEEFGEEIAKRLFY